MKLVGRFLSKVMVSGVVAVTVFCLPSAHGAAGTARVQAIRNGTAQYSTDGQSWKSLNIGAVLKQGATVKTDDKAIVDLFLKQNGPVVRVTPATSLALTAMTFEQASEGETVISTELGLSNGRVLGNVKKLAAASKYDIKTPTATCGIRGTQYDVSSNGRVTVIEGSVSVTYTSPNGTVTTTTVVAGQTFEPTGNNNQGGVIVTPPGLVEQARGELLEADSSMQLKSGGEIVIVVDPPKPPAEVIEPTTKVQ